MASSIGIKLADGTFYPILKEDAFVSKNLELTTIRDNQESVQINLFRKEDENTSEYVGSLIVEKISDGNAGEPTISLNIKLDADKNLSAEAVDEGSGSRQSLKVSLKTLSEDRREINDFDLSTVDISNDIDDDPYRENLFISDSDVDYSFKAEEKSKKGAGSWLVIILILLCIGALVAAILLLTKKMPFADKSNLSSNEVIENKINDNKSTENKIDDENVTVPPIEDQEAKRLAEEAEAKRLAEMNKKNNAKNIIKNPNGTVRYKIKWGDTLWDLSETFYKNPWLYKKIAKHNKIKNPNLIVSGTYIDIPPK